MLSTKNRAEELRLEGLAKVRLGELEDAIALYDEAVALSEDEEQQELITINKASALIALERGGPEVQELARVIMARRNPKHTFLAAYALMFKHRQQNDFKRGAFYGQIALDLAVSAGEPAWKLGTLNELGVIYEIDSQFDKAIDCFGQALALIEDIEDPDERKLSHGAAKQNLGSSKLLNGEHAEGIRLIHEAMPYIFSDAARAEAHIDLCYGYLGIEDVENARNHGETGLQLASEPRQIRNAHYLLGEVAHQSDDHQTAEYHFGELARFYPEFRNLKSLLYAIDLRSIVNLKL
ncbi:MAG: tetratricopeptide repeat protein [Acidobacteria bacterium]|nr:tetratricopeptide repeat protein [Acidobacteriota bacterium]